LKQHLDPTREQVWDEFWGQRPSVADIYPAVSDIATEILQTFPEPRGLRFLEVGAGTGREGHAFAQRGAEVTLLDISWEALRLSREVSSLPRFVRGNALEAPFLDGAFNLVYHQGLLEHFRNPVPLLRENHRPDEVTRPSQRQDTPRLRPEIWQDPLCWKDLHLTLGCR